MKKLWPHATSILLLGCVSHAAPRSVEPVASVAPSHSEITDASVSPAADMTPPAVVNSVGECTSFTLERLTAIENVVIGVYAVRSLKSRAECMCMSSAIAYSVVERFDLAEGSKTVTEERERVYGVVDPSDSDKSVALVVSPDLRAYSSKSLTLKLNCKRPD